MKQIFQLSVVGFISLFTACGDAGSEGEAADSSAMVGADTATAAPVNPVVTKTIQLSSSQEVPANSSTASGTADVSYNKDTKTLMYTVNYSGLTGAATMAHIHGIAAKGANSGVAHDLTGKLQKAASGNFSDTVAIGDKFKEDSLLTGYYYFNIHTKKNPGGEIRGQIEF